MRVSAAACAASPSHILLAARTHVHELRRGATAPRAIALPGVHEVAAGLRRSWAACPAGVYTWTDRAPEPQLVWRGAAHIAAGLEHAVLLAHGAVWTAGLNTDGQLGRPARALEPAFGRVALGGGSAAPAAVRAGGDTSLALGRDGGVWVWGNAEYGQLAAGDRICAPQRALAPDTLGPIVDAAVGGSFIVLLNGTCSSGGRGWRRDQQMHGDDDTRRAAHRAQHAWRRPP